MSIVDHPLDDQLCAALDAAKNETACYHIRQAMQLHIANQTLREDDRETSLGEREDAGETFSA